MEELLDETVRNENRNAKNKYSNLINENILIIMGKQSKNYIYFDTTARNPYRLRHLLRIAKIIDPISSIPSLHIAALIFIAAFLSMFMNNLRECRIVAYCTSLPKRI